MGMSTFVVGFKPPDEKWKAMYKVWLACKEGGIKIPDEIDDFFEGVNPDKAGVEVDLERLECCAEYKDDSSEGFEIHLDTLPKGIKIIRFCNSW